MRIDDDAGLDAEGVSHHDIGRLAAHSIEGDEGLHRLRNLSPVLFHQDATAGLDIAGLVAEEPDAADVMGQGFRIRLGIVTGGSVFLE